MAEHRDYPLRVLVACGAIAVLAVVASLDAYQSTYAYNHAYSDPYHVNGQPTRFREVYDYVPPGTEMGYLCDLPPSGTPYTGAYLTAQHALAPRLLVDGAHAFEHEWILGNYEKEQDYARIAREHGLQLIKDLGHGVVLFRKAGR